MARRSRLIAGPRFAALLVLVLLLHAVALYWLAATLAEQHSQLRSMPPPMFTRLLAPEPPAVAPPVAPAPSATAAIPSRPSITTVAKPKAVPPTPPASAAEASGPEPAMPSGEETGIAESTPNTSTATVATPAQSAPETTTPVAEATAQRASAPSSSIASPTSALDSWPGDTRLSYRLGGYFRGELHGSASVQWQRQDNRYQNRVEIDLTLLASLTLTSQGDVTPQGLMPRIYEESRRSGPRVARFGENWITLNDGRTVPRPQGVQDTASQFVELSHRFASGRDVLEVGRSVSLWMARPGGLDLWTYDIVAREMLQTPGLGAVEAFRLKPRPIANPRGNISAEMWFAPSLQYLPVRIRVNMGEDTYVDLMVEKIEQR